MHVSEQPTTKAPLYEFLRGVSREEITAMKRVADTCTPDEFVQYLAASPGAVPQVLLAEDLGCWGPGPTTFRPDAEGPETPQG